MAMCETSWKHVARRLCLEDGLGQYVLRSPRENRDRPAPNLYVTCSIGRSWRVDLCSTLLGLCRV